ncbi:hypothetical protein ACQLT9_005961 [Salmonella enterica subsp. diarizonae]
MNLYKTLLAVYGSNAAIGRRFPRRGKPRSGQAVGKWQKRGVPEDVAILSHLDPGIPYEHPALLERMHHDTSTEV